MKKLLIFTITVFMLTSCVKRVSYYNPKKRKINEIEVEHKEKELSDNSLWSERSSNISFFTEIKAHKLNDIIQVLVSENDAAQKKAGTKLKRKSDTDFGATNLFGLLKTFQGKHPNMTLDDLVKASSKNDFEGSGDTSRTETIDAKITVIIKKVFDSGNLFIEGEKVTLVNGEEQHLYLSGIIRPEDISHENTVPSDRIAEMQIEFAGRGVVSDKQTPGFGSRIVDWVWPF